MAPRNRFRTVLVLAVASCASPGPERGGPLDPDPVEVASRVARYTKVEAELASADLSALTPAQRSARTRVLAALGEYRAAADFGRSRDADAVREHLFVDDDGRRCAVAQLLHTTGDDELVAAVASSNNGAHVVELASEPRFRDWLDRSGLSITEAARIQGPAFNAVSVPPPQSNSFGQGDGEGGSPAGGGTSGGPPTGGGGADGPATGGGTPSGRDPFAGAGADGWWIWWELAKLDFVRPSRDGIESGAVTHGTDATSADTFLRERAMAALVPLLGHREPAVRATAVLAVGRLGGPDAATLVAPLVQDGDAAVADRALLALGATGSARAVEALGDVVRKGHVGDAKKDLPRASRHVALVALGIARRRGAPAAAADVVTQALDRAKRRDLDDVAYAAEVYAALSPDAPVVAALARIESESNPPEGARGKGLERLAGSSDAASVRVLQGALGQRSVHARRSAAATLGVVEHGLVVPHLQSAVDLENDALTRGLGLISIGRRGGDGARKYLVAVLGDRDVTLRPWAALGLGILARAHGDTAARDALRTADLGEGGRGALSIARGLARDADAVPGIAVALRDAASERTRDQAAFALALVGDDAARRALRAAAATEKSPQVRAALAVALSIQGNDADTPAIVGAVNDVDPDWLRVVLGVAGGYHRSRSTVDGLQRVLESSDSRPAALAAAAEGLGFALDRHRAPVMPTLTRATDFSTLPAWFIEVLRTTL